MIAAQDEVRAWLAARGVELPQEAWERLAAYARLVLEHSARANITAAGDEGELWRRHIADGLAALGPLRERLAAAPRLLDLGSGAGFVGVALACAWPGAAVTLVDSVYKKASFLTLAAARLGLPCRVLHARADGTGRLDLLSARGGSTGRREEPAADAVLARALAPLPEALSLALPLARPGGLAVVYQSAAPEGGESYRLPGEDYNRWLALARRDA